MNIQKKALAVHDISCIGRCSLTVALPIMSAAGIETSVLPTAMLSTHTGGFEGYTFADFTDELPPIANHWKTLNRKFECIYSGYLGSEKQIEIVEGLFDSFAAEKCIRLVDPVMADNGNFYSIFNEDFAKRMAKLCSKADIIIPNITEACFLLGEEYVEGPYTESYVNNLLEMLLSLGVKGVVLTGVHFDDYNLGAASVVAGGKPNYYFRKKIDGYYHGTGDVFGSALGSALLNGFELADASRIAVDYTCNCIERTYREQTDIKYGVNFENEIPSLLKLLKII